MKRMLYKFKPYLSTPLRYCKCTTRFNGFFMQFLFHLPTETSAMCSVHVGKIKQMKDHVSLALLATRAFFSLLFLEPAHVPFSTKTIGSTPQESWTSRLLIRIHHTMNVRWRGAVCTPRLNLSCLIDSITIRFTIATVRSACAKDHFLKKNLFLSLVW